MKGFVYGVDRFVSVGRLSNLGHLGAAAKRLMGCLCVVWGDVLVLVSRGKGYVLFHLDTFDY